MPMCPECGAVEQAGELCARCGHQLAPAAPAEPRAQSAESARAWARVERVTWAYMALVGSMRFGLALAEGPRRWWMLLSAAAVVLVVLWAMHTRRVAVLKVWAITVCAGAIASIPTTAWTLWVSSGEGLVPRGLVAVFGAVAACGYAVELLRAKRVITRL